MSPDPLAAVVQVQVVDPGEELEVDAVGAQCLVERGDDDVAHARGHLPEDGSLVVEERLGRQEHSESGPEAGLVRIAVPEPEHQVVQAPDQRAVRGVGVRPVAQRPGPVVGVELRRIREGSARTPSVTSPRT